MQGQTISENLFQHKIKGTSGKTSPIAEGLMCMQALQLPERFHALLQPPDSGCLGLLILCTCSHVHQGHAVLLALECCVKEVHE